jgi:DNA uptake protein ComE-like DNA-binding protein
MQRGLGFAYLFLLLAAFALLQSRRATATDASALFKNVRAPFELNQADSLALLHVVGLGPTRVHQVLCNRAIQGPFASVDSLRRIHGLSGHLAPYWASIRRWLWVDEDKLYVQFLERRAYQPSCVDLNSTSSENLLEAGILPGSRARSILERRTRLGGFHYWADVAGRSKLDAPWVPVLQRYFCLVEKPIDLNLATEAELRRLPNMRADDARRILRYRAALGFYVNLMQLAEALVSQADRLNLLKSYFVLSAATTRFPHLPLNPDSTSQLSRHPYLSYAQAQAVIQHRKRYGDYTQPVQWGSVPAIDSLTLARVLPYVR